MRKKAAPKNTKREKPLSVKNEAATCAQGLQRRHDSRTGLEYQLRFETLVSELSARFVNIAPDQVDGEIVHALEQVLEFFQVDRCGLLGLSSDRTRVHLTHAAYAEAIERVSGDIDFATLFPWVYERLVLQGLPVDIAGIEDLPEKAGQDRASCTAMGIRSFLDIPLFFEGRVSSIIVINAMRRHRFWPAEYIPRLRLLGEIFLNALERKRSDQALRESEMRLSLATEAVGAGLWIMDVDNSRVWVSPKSRELFHFGPDEEIHYENYFRVIHPEDRDRVHQDVQQALRSGKTLNCDYRIVLPDGSIRWIVARGQRFLKSTGEPDRIMGLSLDITDRKRAEAALEESRTQIAAVMNSTKDFIWSVDPERFGLLTWNRAFWDYFFEQRGIELAAGMTPAELVPPDYVPLWHGLFSRALREELVVTEYVVVAQTITLLLSLQVMKKGDQVFGISVFGKDITERKRAEQELRQSEERFRQVAESVGDFIWEVDANGLYRYTSPAVVKILGYTPDELIGRMYFYDLFAPEVREELKAAAFKVFVAKNSFRAFPNANMSKDGKIVHLETSGVPVLDEAGNLVGYRGSDTDITERKQMQDQLRTAAEEWHKTFNTIQDMIMIMDREFRIVQVNDAAMKFFALPKEKIIGTPCYTLMHGTESPIDGCPYKQMMDTRCHEETEVYDPERDMWFHVVVDPLLDEMDDIIGVVHTVKDITERKQAEAARRESNERHRAVVETFDGFIYICSPDYRVEFMNQRMIGRTGRNAVGELCYTALHDLDSICPWCVNEQVFRGETVRWEVQSPKDHRWYYVVNTPLRHADGTISKQAMIMDIHERKLAEETLKQSESALRNSQKDLRRLAGRLISAQEEELRRLSRELHDDLTQRLAVLAIEAGKLELELKEEPGSLSAPSQKIGQIKEQLIKVSEDVHHISRQLHPSILDDLGLVRAIESQCLTFFRREQIQITFLKENVPPRIPADIALCLYRVVQESLRNIIRHSQAGGAEIFLKGADDGISLTIEDAGIGFDPLEVRHKPGLGLASMRERAQLVQGDFSIKSQPGQGTVISIRVPLTRGGE